MNIVPMTESHFEEFWPTFKEVVEAQETYAFDPDISYSEALELWIHSASAAFVAVEDNGIVGSYFLRKNASGPSSHISNCGYIVLPHARKKGVAKALCIHSQEQAIQLGFSAMQFNAVVSTNTVAVKLWKKLGFTIIGTIPKGYKHRRFGYVDSYIMYKELEANHIQGTE